MANLRPPYLATAALSGLLFGAGLYVSQMVDPLKVLRFLDFTAIPSGGWDPSLAFVIVPAILVMFIGRHDMRVSRRPWQRPRRDTGIREPITIITTIDGRDATVEADDFTSVDGNVEV